MPSRGRGGRLCGRLLLHGLLLHGLLLQGLLRSGLLHGRHLLGAGRLLDPCHLHPCHLLRSGGLWCDKRLCGSRELLSTGHRLGPGHRLGSRPLRGSGQLWCETRHLLGRQRLLRSCWRVWEPARCLRRPGNPLWQARGGLCESAGHLR